MQRKYTDVRRGLRTLDEVVDEGKRLRIANEDLSARETAGRLHLAPV